MGKMEIDFTGLTKVIESVKKVQEVMNEIKIHDNHSIPDKVLLPNKYSKTELITGSEKEQKEEAERRRNMPKKVRNFFSSLRMKISGAFDVR